MFSTRWKKLLRDLQSARGRMVMMVVAIAVSIFGVGTILSAYTILTREISRNYLSTNPASALVELNRVDNKLVEAVRARPDIAEAEASSWVMSRVEIRPNEWMPLLLFVVKDFNDLRINTFQPEAGAWPPPEGTILLERAALDLAKAKVGDVLTMQTPNGPKQALTISGTVHDPGLAPAWQEQTLYGYISPATLVQLGESSDLHILKVVVKEQPLNLTAIDAAVGTLAEWLKTQGYTVGEIRIPPPGLHPHQGQMTAILAMLLSFSLMALGLSAILTATMVSGLLAQQIRQIGIMKAIGARSSQITGLYLAMIFAVGLAAVVLGVPLGILAGRGFSRVVAQLLNFTLYSQAVPAWVYLVLVLMGTLVPLVVAMNPIRKTAQITVREILNDYGVSRDSFGTSQLDAWLSKIRGVNNTLILALRNTFRRRGRLLLTLSLLATAGGMFMTGINVKTSWETYLKDAASNRHYDLEIRLNQPARAKKLLSLVETVPGVQQVEAWNLAPVALSRPDGLDIVRTYPDGGHGSFTLRAAPPQSQMLQSPILSGRWLQPDDSGAVVLNHLASSVLFPNVVVGDSIQLTVNDRPATFRVVGIVRELLTPATAYVIPEIFASATGQTLETANAVRIVMQNHDSTSRSVVTGEIERALAVENISLKVVISETMLEGATSGHVYIFIYALLLMAFVMAVVGALGLMSSMSTSVIERTREFGVMRAIGAKSRAILGNVISEGLFIGLMSWAIAIVLSLPLSLIVDALIGNLAFRSPLPLILSPVAVFAWLMIIVVGSIGASAYPARQASQLTVRETLAYV
jgi:putative ABC transport system permease protein